MDHAAAGAAEEEFDTVAESRTCSVVNWAWALGEEAPVQGDVAVHAVVGRGHEE